MKLLAHCGSHWSAALRCSINQCEMQPHGLTVPNISNTYVVCSHSWEMSVASCNEWLVLIQSYFTFYKRFTHYYYYLFFFLHEKLQTWAVCTILSGVFLFIIKQKSWLFSIYRLRGFLLELTKTNKIVPKHYRILWNLRYLLSSTKSIK